MKRKLTYIAMGVLAMSLAVYSCKKQEMLPTPQRTAQVTITISNSEGPLAQTEGGPLGSALISALHAHTDQVSNLDHLSSIDSEMQNLNTGEVVLTLPMDMSLRLLKSGFYKQYTKQEILDNKIPSDRQGLSDPFVITEETETVALAIEQHLAPEILEITPQDGSTAVPIDTNVQIVFSNPMDLTSFATNDGTHDCSGAVLISSDNFQTCHPLSDDKAMSEDAKSVTLSLAEFLQPQTNYLIRVTNMLTDKLGMHPTETLTYSQGFETAIEEVVETVLELGVWDEGLWDEVAWGP